MDIFFIKKPELVAQAFFINASSSPKGPFPAVPDKISPVRVFIG
jgi:hypothetical protein